MSPCGRRAYLVGLCLLEAGSGVDDLLLRDFFWEKRLDREEELDLLLDRLAREEGLARPFESSMARTTVNLL